MFGVNFFKKNESPHTHPSPEEAQHLNTPHEQTSKNNDLIETPDIHAFDDLNDFLQIERVQQEIQFSGFGIEKPKSFFHAEIPIVEELDTKNSSNRAIETSFENREEEVFTKEDSQQKNKNQEITPLSETDLVAQIITEYNKSVFAQKAKEALIRRGVNEKKLPNILEQLFTKMAHKSIEAFKGDITQILFESGFDELDAENYIYWRFNEYTQDNSMRLITNGEKEALIADNFLTEELITLFQTQQENMTEAVTEERDATIVTSEKIDELISEIENA